MMLNDQNMGSILKVRLKKCGQDVTIFHLVKRVKPEVIEIGDYSRIGDFTFTYGGKGIKIGLREKRKRT